MSSREWPERAKCSEHDVSIKHRIEYVSVHSFQSVYLP